MIISILQLNINSDNHWDKLMQFLKTSSYDVFMLQEITGLGTKCGNINSTRDCFKELQILLGGDYIGELAISDTVSSGPDSYIGISIFYKKQYRIIDKNIIVLNKPQNPFSSNAVSFEGLGKNILHLKLSINNKIISLLNTHAAWANDPGEHPHQTEQGEILINYLKTISAPYILAGDFNLGPDTPLIQKISAIARNLVTENNISNTINPRIHRVKVLFPPGVAVDYIFISHDLSPMEFNVIDDDISDHFGLSLKIEI